MCKYLLDFMGFNADKPLEKQLLPEDYYNNKTKLSIISLNVQYDLRVPPPPPQWLHKAMMHKSPVFDSSSHM